MSACRTCHQIDRDMPQRVVAVVQGVTHVQRINKGSEAEDLLKAARYLMDLAVTLAPVEGQPSNG